jgi:hypothetical protein
MQDPMFFANQYADPWHTHPELDALNAFVQYSQLNQWYVNGEDLLLSTIGGQYGTNAAGAIVRTRGYNAGQKDAGKRVSATQVTQVMAGVVGIGFLPKAIASAIKVIVDEVGAPIYVVGGYASGVHHNPVPDYDLYYDLEYAAVWGEYQLTAFKNTGGNGFPAGCTFDPVNMSFTDMWHGLGYTPVHKPYILFTPGRDPWFEP